MESVGVYKLLQEAGRGAFGVVYWAENTITGQKTALKILSGKQAQRELAGLIRYRECRHANLLQIHHIDRLPDGRLFYTMDAADNCAASGYEADTLANRGQLAAEELRQIILHILDGLEVLHNKKLIHRDIKPENILFINGEPILGDIGLTANFSSASIAGTWQYLPPEVISGQRPPDASSDLYALSRVAYTVLTGYAPGKYPALPGKLPPEAANILEFCRLAGKNQVDIAACRKALTKKTVPFRRQLFTAAAAVAAVAVIGTLLIALPKRTPVPKALAPAVRSIQVQPAPVKLRSAKTTVVSAPAKSASGGSSAVNMFQPLTTDELKKALAELSAQYPEVPEELAKRADDLHSKTFMAYATKLQKLQENNLDNQLIDTEEKYARLRETDRLLQLASLTNSIDSHKRLVCSQRYRMHLDRLKSLYAQRQQLLEDLQQNPPPPDSNQAIYSFE